MMDIRGKVEMVAVMGLLLVGIGMALSAQLYPGEDEQTNMCLNDGINMLLDINSI